MAGETVLRGRVSPAVELLEAQSGVCAGRSWVGCGVWAGQHWVSGSCHHAGQGRVDGSVSAEGPSLSLWDAHPCQACAGTSMKGVTLSLFLVLPDLEVSAWHLC